MDAGWLWSAGRAKLGPMVTYGSMTFAKETLDGQQLDAPSKNTQTLLNPQIAVFWNLL
jgi:hypothetical protein